MRVITSILLLATCAAGFGQTSPPAHVDWRSSGAVTPVKNQGMCGADYAFATTAVVEAAHKIATGHLLSLSEQELVDCSNVNGNQGCNGGMADRAMEWIVQHGIVMQADYPYTARVGSCRQTAKPVAHLTSFRNVPLDAASLLEAVAKHPVAALIDASGTEFQSYEGGVYGCRAASGNHWVAIVGYGATSTGQPYWIIKNSHGTAWGESGYMRLTRAAGCKNIFAAVAPVM
jgi:C1A family cysteine protease